MSAISARRPIAIIGSVDIQRSDYDPPIRNSPQAPAAGRALGKALAEAEYPILVFSSSPNYLECHIVDGYVQSGKAKPKSIIMLYPRQKDPNIHGEFPEQQTSPALFDQRTDSHPRWEASYYQSLPGVDGLLVLGGGRATLIMGLMALADKVPIVSLGTFGGSAEEIWAMMGDKNWIDTADRQEMGRGGWSDDSATGLIASLEKQKTRLESMKEENKSLAQQQQLDRKRRSQRALLFGAIGAVLTVLGVFGSPDFFGAKTWLVLYAACFVAVPICAGIAGSMFYTLRRAVARPPSIEEAQAHGFWAGLGSAVLFFVSQVTSNRQITNLHNAVVQGIGGLDILLLFSLTIAFVAGLTYEAVFGKWEAIDASRSAALDGQLRQ